MYAGMRMSQVDQVSNAAVQMSSWAALLCYCPAIVLPLLLLLLDINTTYTEMSAGFAFSYKISISRVTEICETRLGARSGQYIAEQTQVKNPRAYFDFRYLHTKNDQKCKSERPGLGGTKSASTADLAKPRPQQDSE